MAANTIKGNNTGSAADPKDLTAAEVRTLLNVANGANNYSLPLAANDTRGGVKVGYTENGKNYPVELSSEKMYVNVPWTDTNTNTFLNDVSVVDNGANIILRHTMSNSTSHDIGITAGTNITLTEGTDTFEIATTAEANQNAISTIGLGTYTSNGGGDTNMSATTATDEIALHFWNDSFTTSAASKIGLIRLKDDQSDNIYQMGRTGTGYVKIDASTQNGVDFYNTASTPVVKARITSGGVIHAADDVIAFSSSMTSDVKLKENIERVEGALEKVSQLDGVTFDWKDGRGPSAGVIAQNVEEVLPSAVSEVESIRWKW